MEVYSATLQQFLRKCIDELPYNQRVQLKTLRTCNTRLSKDVYGHQPGLALMSNGESASFFGLMYCDNIWACPCCTAKKMAAYAEQFTVLLEEMKKRGYFAFMATFTIPHLAFMFCRETTDIFYNVWKFFNRSRNYVGKGGKNVICKFNEAVNLKHFVATLEYTYGKNGWHPHMHVIFWVKNQYKDEILKWEKPISECLTRAAKRETLKYWNSHNLYASQEWREKKVEEIYSNLNDISECFYISKKDGKIAECDVAYYLAGWGASSELSQLQHKTAKDGHLTPHQILQLAYEGDEKMKRLYMQFCLAVTTKPFHRRVTWSRTGLHDILVTCMNQKLYKDLIKKKESRATNGGKGWELLLWFDSAQYSYILELSKTSPIFANILWLAIHKRELLFEFLDGLGVKYHHKCDHFYREHLEKIYNGEVA